MDNMQSIEDKITEIEFVNHASVLVKYGNYAVLSDPWYSGAAFHDGWNLIYENTENEIDELLKNTTHIWISHEHPDHFSVEFFKKYKDTIKKFRIQVLFQKTRDKRVMKFLNALQVSVQELYFDERTEIGDNLYVTCIKDGYYDSGLFIETADLNILNLNDCEVRTIQRAREIKKQIKNVDILLTQFSYAAWKGGEENIEWRRQAAKEKLETIKVQIQEFEPGYLIPFASFVYFSNVENFYLNDCHNTLDKVIESVGTSNNCQIVCMKPGDAFSQACSLWDNKIAIDFWKDHGVRKLPLNAYKSVTVENLNDAFQTYVRRIYKENSRITIGALKYLSPIPIFRVVTIKLNDLDLCFEIDIVMGTFKRVNRVSDLEMHSESLIFLFNNTFGFDTLTVNGCFRECKRGGFVRATKTLAIENLNNIGIKIQLSSAVNVKLILMFLNRLYRVARKLEN